MREILASIMVYVGLVLVGLGLLLCIVAVLRHRGWVGGGVFIIVGIGIILIAWALPSLKLQVTGQRMQLDEFIPAYQFNEVHTIQINAPKDRVYGAIQSVTASEITLFRTLTWIRRFGRSSPESILNAPDNKPLLEIALRSGFMKLVEQPGQEIVLGTAVAAPANFQSRRELTPEGFKRISAPGFAFAAMNFLVEEKGANSCTVRTETRVYATDNTTMRKFARYWRVIYPGSALIRLMWLRAIKRRAESSTAPRTMTYEKIVLR